MRVVALETSGRLGSVALLEAAGDPATIVREQRLPSGERTARTLLPCLDELLRVQQWEPIDVDLVVTTTGPGSFTGLRIGVVAAKTLAYATGAKLVGVHTLVAIAAAVEPRPARLWTVLDAQRQELFVAHFDALLAVVDQADSGTEILGIDEWLARLSPGDAVAGPPLGELLDRLPPGVVAVDAERWSPSAGAVGRLGVELFGLGRAVDALALVPNYFRRSAAEDKSDN